MLTAELINIVKTVVFFAVASTILFTCCKNRKKPNVKVSEEKDKDEILEEVVEENCLAEETSANDGNDTINELTENGLDEIENLESFDDTIKENKDQTEDEEIEESANYSSAYTADSSYATQKIASAAATDDNVLNIGEFPLLAKVKEDVGKVDWIEASKTGYNVRLPVSGNVGPTVDEALQTAQIFIFDNQDELGVKCTLDELNHIQSELHPMSTKKDGHSAGCAFAAGIMSVLMNRGLPNKLAFLGQISKHGKAIIVDGAKEKISAAKSIGIKSILAPVTMQEAIEALGAEVTSGIEFIYVRTFFDALQYLFPSK